jgi:hypothetical protein
MTIGSILVSLIGIGYGIYLEKGLGLERVRGVHKNPPDGHLASLKSTEKQPARRFAGRGLLDWC